MPKTHHCNASLARGDVPIAELNLDPVEFGFLTASRFFCLSFAEPGTQAWVMTFLASNSFFPDPDSAETMRRALAVVHEMRITRRSVFRFSNPRCEGCSGIVTHDERHLVQLVRAVRNGHMSRAASSALLLCEGNDTKRLLTAVEDFSKVFATKKVDALH